MTWEKCQSVLKLLHGDKCGSHHRHMGSLDKDESLGKFGGSASELRGVLPTALLAENRTGEHPQLSLSSSSLSTTLFRCKQTSFKLQSKDKERVYSLTQSCPTLCDPMDCSPLLCPWDFSGKNTEVGCHFLLQEIFPTQGSNPHTLHWQVGSLPLGHLGSPMTKHLPF